MAIPSRLWEIPEGLKVRPDGSWRIGDLQVILLAHVGQQDGRFYLQAGERRLPVRA